MQQPCQILKSPANTGFPVLPGEKGKVFLDQSPLRCQENHIVQGFHFFLTEKLSSSCRKNTPRFSAFCWQSLVEGLPGTLSGSAKSQISQREALAQMPFLSSPEEYSWEKMRHSGAPLPNNSQNETLRMQEIPFFRMEKEAGISFLWECFFRSRRNPNPHPFENPIRLPFPPLPTAGNSFRIFQPHRFLLSKTAQISFRKSKCFLKSTFQ